MSETETSVKYLCHRLLSHVGLLTRGPQSTGEDQVIDTKDTVFVLRNSGVVFVPDTPLTHKESLLRI